MSEKSIEIRETADFAPLAVLYNASGLEVKPDADAPEGTLKLWRCDSADGNLLAAATLQKYGESYVLKHLAVDAASRGLHLGERMLGIVEAEVASRGGSEMWLVGKVPEFYKKYGWTVVDPADAPAISKCQTCPQFEKECFPSIMKKEL